MAERGMKKTEWLEFSYGKMQEPIRFPVGTIYGEQDGPTMVVTGGMHGSEFCGIQAAIDLLNDIEPAQLRGTLIIGTIYNFPAFVNHMGFVVPQDGKNPGGTFPGKLYGTYSEVMAHYYTEHVLSKADYYIELHGGDIPEALTPFVICSVTGNTEVDAKIEEMAVAYNIPLIIKGELPKSDRPGGAFRKAAVAGIPAMLTESGQQGILNMEDARRHLTGLKNVLVKLGMIDGEIVDTIERTFLKRVGAVRSDIVGMWYPYVWLNDRVHKDQVLGEIRDYFGKPIKQITSAIDGLVTVVRTSPSVGVGNVLLEYHEFVE